MPVQISVCIPTYNRPALIARAIESILAQSSLPSEIVISDNSENEETEAVVKTFINRSEIPIKYHRHGKNIGIAGNWNSLLYLASGTYVKFLNDDDELLPDCLLAIKRTLSFLNQEVGVVTCAAEYVDENLNFLKRDRRMRGCGLRNYFVFHEYVPFLWVHNALPLRTPTHMTYNRRAAISVGGFREDYDYTRDVHLALEIASEYGALILDEVPLVRFRLHPGQDVKGISIETRLRDLFSTNLWALNKAVDRGFRVDKKAVIGEICLREMLLMLKSNRLSECRVAFNRWVSGGNAKSLFYFINNNVIQFKRYCTYYSKLALGSLK